MEALQLISKGPTGFRDGVPLFTEGLGQSKKKVREARLPMKTLSGEIVTGKEGDQGVWVQDGIDRPAATSLV